ncbi:MAG: 7TM-DISM domain-containing protein [Limisphaerales bacterium]
MNLRFPKLPLVLLLGTLLGLLSQTCWAQASGDAARAPALALTNPFCQLAPGDALRYVRDPSRQATLAQVLAKPPGAWSAFKPGSPTSFGFTPDVFWLRLGLRSAFADTSEIVVELDNPRIEDVDWFALRKGEVRERELNGNQRPSSARLPRPRAPSFRLKLAAGEEVEILARVESRSSMILPVLVYGSPEAQANAAAKRDWVALAAAGFFGSLFCLSVVLGFILRSRLKQINAVISLLLCAYFLLVDGSWARLGLPFAAELAMHPTLLLVAGMDFLAGLFTQQFIPAQFKSRLPGRILGAVLVAVAVEITVIPFLSYRNDFRLVALTSVAVMGNCTAVAWWLYRLRPSGGMRLLLTAWLFNLAVIVNIILELIGAIPAWLPQTMAPLIYGVTICGLFFAASTQRAHEFMREQVRASHLEKSLAEARLLALRYQVNPHFLFNALNTAIALVQHEPARVTPFLYRLATFLRTASHANPLLTVPLAEEVEKLSAYLDVEKVRFEERLQVTLDFPSELGQFQVPELILQPLVEYAIKHGMSQPAKVHRIRLRAGREGDRLQLEVGHTAQLATGSAPGQEAGGIGLNDLRERLQLLYQERSSLTLTEADGWVLARLSLPLVEPPPSAQPPKQNGP